MFFCVVALRSEASSCRNKFACWRVSTRQLYTGLTLAVDFVRLDVPFAHLQALTYYYSTTAAQGHPFCGQEL